MLQILLYGGYRQSQYFSETGHNPRKVMIESLKEVIKQITQKADTETQKDKKKIVRLLFK